MLYRSSAMSSDVQTVLFDVLVGSTAISTHMSNWSEVVRFCGERAETSDSIRIRARVYETSDLSERTEKTVPFRITVSVPFSHICDVEDVLSARSLIVVSE